jgi:maltose O-acetyltransferase
MDTIGQEARNVTTIDGGTGSKANKIARVIREEIEQFHPQLLLMNCLLALLPIYVGGRTRMRILRLAGFQIGHGTVIWGTPSISGNRNLYQRLIIGQNCSINIGCFLDLGAKITIGDNVSIGHQVMVLTTSHKMGSAQRRAGELTTLPVTIEDGAWIGARSIILPGVTIGAGAIISAGAVVNKDVPPNTVAAGSPARVVVPKLR